MVSKRESPKIKENPKTENRKPRPPIRRHNKVCYIIRLKVCSGVVGLDLRRTVVVLRFVDDQDVGETAVIRFWCASQRIKKFGGSHEGKVKRHPVTSAMVARLRIDDERAGPRSLPIQTYKQSWISTAATTTVTAAWVGNSSAQHTVAGRSLR
jgi:hypothetical protein